MRHKLLVGHPFIFIAAYARLPWSTRCLQTLGCTTEHAASMPMWIERPWNVCAERLDGPISHDPTVGHVDVHVAAVIAAHPSRTSS